MPSLAKFGINSDQIVFLPRKSNIKVCEAAILPSYKTHPDLLNELRDILTKDVNDTNFGEKIYISREEQALRFVENEEEVKALLEKYGFKKIIAEKFSYQQQVEIFSKAKYVVSPHGAGLTNMLFMPENSVILEMASDPYPEKLVTDYYKLSSMIGHKYFYQYCKTGPNSKTHDFHHGSLLVDLNILEKNLKLMLDA